MKLLVKFPFLCFPSKWSCFFLKKKTKFAILSVFLSDLSLQQSATLPALVNACLLSDPCWNVFGISLFQNDITRQSSNWPVTPLSHCILGHNCCTALRMVLDLSVVDSFLPSVTYRLVWIENSIYLSIIDCLSGSSLSREAQTGRS